MLKVGGTLAVIHALLAILWAVFMLVSQARPNQFQCRLLSVSPKYLCHSGNFQCTRLQPYTVVKVVSGMGQDPVIEVAILG